MVTGAPATITGRDLDALRFVGEQYAVPMALLAEVLSAPTASGARMARRTAERLERLGYAGRRPLIGQQWLVPTRPGLRAAGLPYKAEVPAEILLQHVAAVGRLRLHLTAAYPTATWESERAIRQRCADAPVRRCDGGLWWAEGDATGIELEREVKQPHRYLGIVTATDSTWSAIWWFAKAEHVPLLTTRLADAGGGDRHLVYPLPPEVAL